MGGARKTKISLLTDFSLWMFNYFRDGTSNLLPERLCLQAPVLGTEQNDRWVVWDLTVNSQISLNPCHHSTSFQFLARPRQASYLPAAVPSQRKSLAPEVWEREPYLAIWNRGRDLGIYLLPKLNFNKNWLMFPSLLSLSDVSNFWYLMRFHGKNWPISPTSQTCPPYVLSLLG